MSTVGKAQSEVHRVLVEHQALDEAAAKLERVIAFGQERHHDTFNMLAAYASQLAEHLLDEHDVIHDAHARRGQSGTSGPHAMRTELERLTWDWEEYLSVWTEDSAAEDWSTFSEHSLALLSRIRRRIAHENELLNRV